MEGGQTVGGGEDSVRGGSGSGDDADDVELVPMEEAEEGGNREFSSSSSPDDKNQSRMPSNRNFRSVSIMMFAV